MSDMNVDDLFPERSYSASMTLRAPMMSARDRKRLLVHATTELTQKLLDMPNANPEGLCITVTSEAPPHPDMWPTLVVMATCPQYERADVIVD